MTRDDIIKMAREAKLPYEYDTGRVLHLKDLEHFAALLEDRLKFDGIHTCHDQCQRPACVAVRNAVERERKACATIAEFNQANHLEHLTAEQIRARGQQ
jgi:hypothetical protein